MGLNMYPAPQNSLGFSNVGAVDLNFGMNNAQNLNMPVGPAPAASAATMVPTVGTSPMDGLTVPGGVTAAMQAAMADPNAGFRNFDPVSADGLGWNSMAYMDKAKVVMGGLSTLGSLWNAFQSNKIARESLDFQKKAYKENLSNQRSSYNMALEDRANARYAQMGRSDDAAAYIEKHRL